MNKYLRLYGWLWETFKDKKFSLREFKTVFPSPQHKKIIFDLIRSGYVKRTSRGIYKTIEPRKFVEKIVVTNLKQKNILEKAREKYAFCNNDAVTIWTDGYYWTGFTRGFKPVHIEVREKDLGWWRDFFKRNGVEFALEGESRTLFGLMYILHPRGDFRVEKKDNAFVVPLDETVEFCMKNRLIYEPALEYLDKHHNLGLLEKYEHIIH
ncbi:MAG: hypothetical protein U9M95_02410 [Candidatus Altiarchaeota archaeon]|nr:hypothetical protein [Candidatus Altiarchaeota archaeon]